MKYFYDGEFVDRNGDAICSEGAKNISSFNETSPTLVVKIVGVLFEAIFDYLLKVDINGTLLEDDKLKECSCYRTSLITESMADRKDESTGTLYPAKEIGKLVRRYSVKAGDETRSIIGGTVRGGGVIALNNEVLIEAVSTAGGALVKKVSEACIYRALCDFIEDVDLQQYSSSCDLKKKLWDSAV